MSHRIPRFDEPEREPRYTETISVVLTREQAAWVRAEAARRKISLSAFVRVAVGALARP